MCKPKRKINRSVNSPLCLFWSFLSVYHLFSINVFVSVCALGFKEFCRRPNLFIMVGDIRRSHLVLTAEKEKEPQRRINRPQRECQSEEEEEVAESV